jgi:hypothetical protein
MLYAYLIGYVVGVISGTIFGWWMRLLWVNHRYKRYERRIDPRFWRGTD